MGVGSGMRDGGDLGSRCQARGTRRMTGASISLEWTMTCVESLRGSRRGDLQDYTALEEGTVDGEGLVLPALAAGVAALDVADVQEVGL